MMQQFKVRDSRRKGYFNTDNEIIDIYAKEIGCTALSVYFTLCRHSDKQQEAFPSQQMIADKLGLSRDTVTEKIAILVKNNLIQVEQTKDQDTGKWLHNTYILLDKTVWRIPPYGEKEGTVSHDTVGGNSDTNNTNDLKKPISKILENDPLKERREAREYRKSRKGKGLGGYSAPLPNYTKLNSNTNYHKVKTGTHAEDII